MIRVTIACSAETKEFLEELLWAHEALSVSSPALHASARFLEALFAEVEEGALTEQLRAAIPGLGQIRFEEVQEQAWQETWRENFKPLQVGKFTLVGEWEASIQDAPEIIRIYPGMAFGTGQHETTQLIIERLQELDLGAKKVLDAGCGTGILAIAAERLGAAEVFGYDIDPDCEENMIHHLTINRCTRTRLAIGVLEDFPESSYDVIVANITINVLREVWPSLRRQLAPGGVILNSGILEEQKAEALTVLAELGYAVEQIRHKGEWLMIQAHGV